MVAPANTQVLVDRDSSVATLAFTSPAVVEGMQVVGPVPVESLFVAGEAPSLSFTTPVPGLYTVTLLPSGESFTLPLIGKLLMARWDILHHSAGDNKLLRTLDVLLHSFYSAVGEDDIATATSLLDYLFLLTQDASCDGL